MGQNISDIFQISLKPLIVLLRLGPLKKALILKKGKGTTRLIGATEEKYLFHFYDPVFGVYLRKGESEKRVKTLNNLMSHNKRNWTFTATARGPIERTDKFEVYVLSRLFVKHKGIEMISAKAI